MLGKIYKLIVRQTIKVYIAVAVTAVLAGIFLYFYSSKITENRVVEQMLHREQVITRAGAMSIRTYLNLTKRSLLVLSRSPRIFSLDQTTQVALDEFIHDWDGSSLVSVIIIDKEGKIEHISGQGVGVADRDVNFVDRDYFQWAKTAKVGEVYIGDAIQARMGEYQGQFIFPLATPIFLDNKFRGVLVAGILASRLTENFLEPLKISADSKVYLLNSVGEIVYADFDSLIGVNVVNYLEEHPFLGSSLIVQEVQNRFSKLTREAEGKMVYTRNDYDNQLNFQKWLLTYSKVTVDSTDLQRNWILAVETPNSDALLLGNSFFNTQTLVLIFFILVICGLITFSIFIFRAREKEAYLKGYYQCRRKK